MGKNMNSAKSKGKVWIVGAGPGDPDLLTLRAHKIIRGADLILFDHLVSAEIRQLFPQAVPAFCVGKRKGNHSIDQQDLNALLIKKAREGKTICRLKGGDPFVFGRGGEELLSLVHAGVDAEVVPGITAASGCSTYAGIPLTHRGVSQGCTFVTGHGEHEPNLNWPALAQLNHTLVFYMGMTHAESIREQLIVNGMPENTPAALIENGCRDDQRVFVGSLGRLPSMIAENQVQSPTLIVVGEVVSFAEQFNPQVFAAQLTEQFNQHSFNHVPCSFGQDRLTA
jgi:uroporphyrin-III C-methyltransferase